MGQCIRRRLYLRGGLACIDGIELLDTTFDLTLLEERSGFESVQEGQAIAFMGFPIGGALGFSPVTHRGTVSSIAAAALPTPSAQQLNEKTIRGLRTGSFNIFQLDGTAYPGNSGGPLFDPETGDVLGVVNMVFIKGSRESALSNPSGISFAIPSTFIQQLVKRSRTSGD